MDLLGPGAEAIARSVPSWYGMAVAAALLSLLIGSVTCKAYGRDPSAVLILALVMSSSVLPSASAFDERPPSSLMPPSSLLARPGSLSRQRGVQAPSHMLRLRGGAAGGGDAAGGRIQYGSMTPYSISTFSFVNPIIEAGYKAPLEESQLPPLSTCDGAQQHALSLETELSRLVNVARNQSAPPCPPGTSDDEMEAKRSAKVQAGLEGALLRSVISVFGKEFLAGGAWKLPQDLLTFLSPFLVKAVYAYVDPSKGKAGQAAEGATELPTWKKGLMICAAFFFSQIASSVFLHQYFDKVFRCSLQCRGALVAAIYRKSLRLSHTSRGEKSLGELVNLMTVDVQRLTDLIPYLHSLLWSSPLQIFVSMVLLYRLVGISSLVGLGVMLAVMPINASILLKLRSLQESNMREKDKRVKTVSEILQSMKVIKMFAWEKPLTKRVADIRAEEVQRLKTYGYISSLQSIFWNSAPITVSIATFGAYAYLGNKLEMSVVLPALSIINIMSFPLFVFPLLISAVISGKVAMKRLSDYMNLEERDASAVTHTEPASVLPISFDNATIGWNATSAVLSGVSLTIERGSLTAIVGPVGSGKSTLLSAMLGDAVLVSGSVHAPKKMAYVPQQAWIQNANLRDNIMFGGEYDEAHYEETVECCSLKRDFELFPGGDKTEIGERGVNLSGGQKQRVSLARAVYARDDVVLLDDPMSALDGHVGHAVFDQCIEGKLKGKTRVLVTHKLDILPACDKIVILEGGKIAHQGTYSELIAKGVNLGAVCAEYDDEVAATESTGSGSSKKADDLGSTPPPQTASKTSQKGGDARVEAGKGGKAGEEGGGAKIVRSSSVGQITEESRQKGALSKDVYMYYVKELSLPALIACGAVGILSQAARNGNDWWLTRWASAADGHRVSFYLGVYAAWNLVASLLFLARDVSLMLVELAAASSLHNAMLKSVMGAPVKFFDQTPIGRILNRFSNDQDSLDLTLPRTLNQLYSCMLRVIGTIAVISFVSPGFLVATIPISWLYYHAKELYSKTSRELKRIESNTKSPLYSHFGESITGASCIRAASAEQRFRDENIARIDRVNGLFSLINHCNRWLALRLELCGNGIVTGAALTGVVSRRMGWLSKERATLVGLSLTLALAVTNSLGWMVRMSTEAESQMNSVERVAEYVTLQSEEAWLGSLVGGVGEGKNATSAPSGWPHSGGVTFANYSMAYREGLPLVLDGVNLEIKAGDKVGVCGRTGAGKSSLLMALYRMAEVRGGQIILDGVDIASVSLESLRGALAIVPQEPMLFQGSVSYNLDPFDDFTEDQKWEALRSVQLDDVVRALSEGLNSNVGEGGSRLSVGQRQLLCMARALMRGAKVLVLDEATAAVDHETDAMIQKAVREACKECTVITIAHRLNTIMDYDKVVVMGAGKVVEFGEPTSLLANKQGAFTDLVRGSRMNRIMSRESLASSEPETKD